MTEEIKQVTDEKIETAPLAEEKNNAEIANIEKTETPEAEVAPENNEEQEEKSVEELPLPEEDKDYEKNWPKGFKERLKRQNKQLEQREQEARRLQEELVQLKSVMAKPSVETDMQGSPIRENFASEDAYIEAMIDYKAKKREEELYKSMYEKKTIEELQNRQKQQDKIDEDGIKKYPDYEETVQVLFKKDFPANEGMYRAIVKSKHAADILYHLGRYPDQAKETAKLDPVEAIKKIVKLEERLEARKKGNITKMPAPLTKLSGSSANLSTKNPDQMSPSEYRQWREESKVVKKK